MSYYGNSQSYGGYGGPPPPAPSYGQRSSYQDSSFGGYGSAVPFYEQQQQQYAPPYPLANAAISQLNLPPPQPQSSIDEVVAKEEILRLRQDKEKLLEQQAYTTAELENLRSQYNFKEQELRQKSEEVEIYRVRLEQEKAQMDNTMRVVSERERAVHVEINLKDNDVPLVEQHLQQVEANRMQMEIQLRDAFARQQFSEEEIRRLQDAEVKRLEYIESMKLAFESERSRLDLELQREQETSRRERQLRDEAESRAVSAENQLRLASDTMAVRIATDKVDVSTREAEIARIKELMRQHNALGQLLGQSLGTWTDMEYSWVSTLVDIPASAQHAPPPPRPSSLATAPPPPPASSYAPVPYGANPYPAPPQGPSSSYAPPPPAPSSYSPYSNQLNTSSYINAPPPAQYGRPGSYSANSSFY